MITWSDRLELELSILLLGEEGEVEESLVELVASLTDLGPLSAILGTVTMSLSHCCSLVPSHFCKEDLCVRGVRGIRCSQCKNMFNHNQWLLNHTT